MSKPNTCTSCNAVMPSHRVCNLCEECYADEWWNDHDDGDENEDDEWCPACERSGDDVMCPECDSEVF